jgi:DNA repair protein SbcD/Mre11
MIVGFLADSHLGSSRSRIDPEQGLNSRLLDFARCTRFCVEDSVARGARLILHGGDLFNTCRPTPTERRLALEALAPAREAGVPVVLLLGNHDAPRAPAERHALDVMRDLEGIVVADQPGLLNIWDRGGRALVETLDFSPADGADLALQLGCLPWPNRQLLLADEAYRKLEPGQLNEVVRSRVMDVLFGLAAGLTPGVPVLLLAHISIDVAQAGGQSRLMSLGADWTLNLHDLAGLGFDAVCAGHVHRAQVLSETPWIAYAGSPEAVSFGEETDGTKGYFILDTEDLLR